MTTITRFTKEQLIARADHLLCVGKAFIAEHPEYDGMAKDVELFKIALASLEAEQRRNPVLAYADSYRDMAKQGVESIPVWSVITDLERNIAPLYAAPPAPTVTFYRDGIEAAAMWVSQQRDAYDSEHGRHDPDTGSFEFGNDAQRDYSATLEEIAEGIRALHPNTAPPAPVVPTFDEWLEVRGNKPLGWVKDSMREAYDACRAAMLQGKAEPVSNRDELPEEKGSSLQLRNLIRQRHAEWSEKTFGNVGPIGPLKHLSKEALEAAAEPDDLSEWADMQFLLWDAQRRAGISDGEITAAMEEKLKVNMARQWPEPKDGEPRLHIKEAGNSPVIPDGYVLVPKRLTAENGAKSVMIGEFSETKFINCPECFGDGDCETCDGSGRIKISVPVSWTNIKAIWAKGVELFAAVPQQEVDPTPKK